jgi:hypothetical protein
MKTIKGYKAFNKDMTCRGFKFEEGKTYKTDKAKICKKGFHLCTNPLDVLNYYDLCDSVFHEVEGWGKIDTHKEDSKIAVTRIVIGTRLSLKAFIEVSVNFLLKVCKSKGDYSQLASSGDFSQLELNGQNSIGANIGIEGKAKGKKGCWITLAEWKYDDKKKQYIPICVKSVKIDGEKIKEDVWYVLHNKKFVEVGDD